VNCSNLPTVRRFLLTKQGCGVGTIFNLRSRSRRKF